MDSRIPKILEEYSSKYTDNAFYLKRNRIHKGTKQPVLFIFLGTSSLKFRNGIEEYCGRYFSDLSGIAYLSISKNHDGEEVPPHGLSNSFFINIPDSVYSQNLLQDRDSVRAYGESDEFQDVFETCAGSILEFFMEYGNIYDEGGSASIRIVSLVDAPEAGLADKITELIYKFVSHVYNPNFTLFSIFDDINTKKEIKTASYLTFNEIYERYGNGGNVTVILIGSKKLNALFDRPSEVVDNQCHLMALATYISVMSNLELYPSNAQSIYSFGISNLKIIERYVGLSTLACLLGKVVGSI